MEDMIKAVDIGEPTGVHSALYIHLLAVDTADNNQGFRTILME
jgi:hypothetical protein